MSFDEAIYKKKGKFSSQNDAPFDAIVLNKEHVKRYIVCVLRNDASFDEF